jgi:hypothetical protein
MTWGAASARPDCTGGYGAAEALIPSLLAQTSVYTVGRCRVLKPVLKARLVSALEAIM